jgi:hypothetical protein
VRIRPRRTLHALPSSAEERSAARRADAHAGDRLARGLVHDRAGDRRRARETERHRRLGAALHADGVLAGREVILPKRLDRPEPRVDAGEPVRARGVRQHSDVVADDESAGGRLPRGVDDGSLDHSSALDGDPLIQARLELKLVRGHVPGRADENPARRSGRIRNGEASVQARLRLGERLRVDVGERVARDGDHDRAADRLALVVHDAARQGLRRRNVEVVQGGFL